jgi:hypothetical protein
MYLVEWIQSKLQVLLHMILHSRPKAFETLALDYVLAVCVTYGMLRVAAMVGVKRQINRLCKID